MREGTTRREKNDNEHYNYRLLNKQFVTMAASSNDLLFRSFFR